MIRIKFVTISLLLSILFIFNYAQADLPDRLLVGYWHNWGGSPNALLLTDIPAEYDVINIAFSTPTMPSGSMMQFSPESSIYDTPQDFIADIQTLQDAGKKVLYYKRVKCLLLPQSLREHRVTTSCLFSILCELCVSVAKKLSFQPLKV